MNSSRYEEKYLISRYDLTVIRNRLHSLSNMNSNILEKMQYNVKTLYYDDIYNSAVLDKENGEEYRKKYRLRYYDDKNEKVKVEIKIKKDNLTIKNVAIEETSRIKENMKKGWKLSGEKGGVYNEFALNTKINLSKPVIIIQYDREAFELHDMRITIDTNITYSADCDGFFNGIYHTVPILEDQQCILEIKTNGKLNEVLANMVITNGIRKTAFSKYHLAREKMRESYYR